MQESGGEMLGLWGALSKPGWLYFKPYSRHSAAAIGARASRLEQQGNDLKPRTA